MISYSCNVIIRAQQNLCSVLQTFLKHKLFMCAFYSMVYHSFYLVFFFSCKFFSPNEIKGIQGKDTQ